MVLAVLGLMNIALAVFVLFIFLFSGKMWNKFYRIIGNKSLIQPFSELIDTLLSPEKSKG